MTNREQIKRIIERNYLIKMLEFSLPEPQIFDQNIRKLIRKFQINITADTFLKEKYGY